MANRKATKIEKPKETITNASVMLAQNGWVIRTGYNEGHMVSPCDMYIANSPAEIGKVFAKFGVKPAVKRRG